MDKENEKKTKEKLTISLRTAIISFLLVIAISGAFFIIIINNNEKNISTISATDTNDTKAENIRRFYINKTRK